MNATDVNTLTSCTEINIGYWTRKTFGGNFCWKMLGIINGTGTCSDVSVLGKSELEGVGVMAGTGLQFDI